MKTKWVVSLSLLTACTSTLFCVYATNDNITTTSTFSSPEVTKTTLATVYASIPNWVITSGQTPTNSDVLTYLKQQTPSQYADVINDIKIDSIASGTVSFSALPQSRKYTGSKAFSYTLNTVVPLTSIIPNNENLGTDVNWNAQPSNKTFLTFLQSKHPTLNINQVQLDVQDDAYSLGGLNYSLNITAIPNSLVYSGSTIVKYSLNDIRPALSTIFTTKGISTSNKFNWTALSTTYWANSEPSVLSNICQANNVSTQSISNYTWALTCDTSLQTITLTSSNNPNYKDGSITFYYNIVTATPFTYNWEQLLTVGKGANWSYASGNAGGFTFIPMDTDNHYVYVCDASLAKNSGISTKLNAQNLVIGTKVTDSNSQEWTVTGLAGRDENTTIFVSTDGGAFRANTSLGGSVTLPSTMKYVGKNAFRECTNITSLNLNEGLETIGGSSCMTIGATKLSSISVPSTLGELGQFTFGGASLSSVYLYKSNQIYSGQALNTGAVFYSDAKKFTNTTADRTGRIYVPENTLDTYVNDPTWISTIGSGGTSDPTKYTRQVFQPIQKLSNALLPSFNLGSQTINTLYATTYLTLLCQMSNVDIKKITDYEYQIAMDTTNKTITVTVINNPNYYGTATISYNQNAYTYFDLTYSQMNNNGGWNGYTAGNTRFYVVDESNRFVEFVDKNLTGATGGARTMGGNNCTIGNTITNSATGLEYTVLAPFSWSVSAGGFGVYKGTGPLLTGSLTIGNGIKFLPRDSFREQTSLTSVVFAPNSTCESIDSCSLFSLYACPELNIPACVKILGNALGNQTASANQNKITLNQNYVVNPASFFGNFSSLTNHTLRIYVPQVVLNEYRNNSAWISKLGANYINDMIQPIE